MRATLQAVSFLPLGRTGFAIAERRVTKIADLTRRQNAAAASPTVLQL
jgi:hypothetical protein